MPRSFMFAFSALLMAAGVAWAASDSTAPCSADAAGGCAHAAQPVTGRVHELTFDERARIATLQREATGTTSNEEKRQAAAVLIAAIRNGVWARLHPEDRASIERLWREADASDAQARRGAVRKLSALLGSYGFHAWPRQATVPAPLIAQPGPMIAPISPYSGIGASSGTSPYSSSLAPLPPPYPGVRSSPPPAIAPPPRPPLITTCDIGGCWDSSGTRYSASGPMLVAPSGRTCQRVGNMLQCP